MVSNHEKNTANYEPIKEFPKYRINPEKGLVINKTDKYIFHKQPKGVSLIVHLKGDNDKYVKRDVSQLVYNQCHDEPINLKTHRIKHIDKDPTNCKIDNLKIKKRGIRRRTPEINVEVESVQTGNIEKYKNIHQAKHNCDISLHHFRKALKQYKEGKSYLITDKFGNEYNITLSTDYINVVHAPDDKIKDNKFWKI